MKLNVSFKSLRKPMMLAAMLTALSFSAEANAGWLFGGHRGGHHGGHHGGGGGGWGGGGGSGGGVPEIDAGSAAGAMTLLFGGVLMMRDKFNLRHKREE